MTTQVFLEGFALDVSADISSLLTFALDDIKDFASRQTTFSKTIVLPGTANNNKLFGHVFDFGSSNQYDSALPNYGYNFNAAKSANCIIFQDNLQTFSGTLRLLTINVIKGRPEYEVAVFGNLSRLNVLLSPSATNGTGLLENLDFSAYDHVFNNTNIVASWSATPGSGYYYPLADYGTYSTNKHDWKIGTFRPALYAKEYIDKMFAVAGFRYNCQLFDSTRFKNIIVPHNQKLLTRLTNNILSATVIPATPVTVISNASGVDDRGLYWNSAVTSVFLAGAFNETFTYTPGASVTTDITWNITGTRRNQITPIKMTFEINGVALDTQTLLPTGIATVLPFNWAGSLTGVTINTGDVLKWRFDATLSGSDFTYFLTVSNATTQLTSQDTQVVPVVAGDTVQMNYCIPKNVKQIDFFVSIIQLFNLYVYEDKFDSTLVNIAPFNGDGINAGFFSPASNNAVDWTYKLNRDKNISIKPMSELNSKIYNFKYKDDTDYYNDQYKKRYNQGYGSYIFDSQFEFNTAQDNLELVFAPTPLVGYPGEDKIYSTIFKLSGTVEENIDSVIRLLQIKHVSSVTSWDLQDSSGTPVIALTEYGYAGHLDDPDAPDNDLNFGALQQLYFVLVSGDLSNTQFNIYWSSYMAEITDKDSKLITGWFYLKPSDIFNLDFSKYISVDTVLFRLNKIIDYNASNPGDCQVQLLRTINTTYL